ncbi:MAG TPA: hypothetical protein VLI65_00805, partial [Pyrinomonadaceae bacterium]|nr:hypothetical protein [Pyrinomonadaceae bacterium]
MEAARNFRFTVVFTCFVSILKPMKFSLALGGLICLGMITGSAYAITAGTNAPAAAPEATLEELSGNDANAAPAEPDQNPYSSIIRVNAFHLNDPPVPKAKEDPAIMNLPKVNITGFRRREGEPLRALFATVPKDPK